MIRPAVARNERRSASGAVRLRLSDISASKGVHFLAIGRPLTLG